MRKRPLCARRGSPITKRANTNREAAWSIPCRRSPYFVKDYYDYYKTERGYHPRSLNSNGGWNVIGCESFMNQPILKYSNEIRSAVLLIHGEKAHSCYFSRDAYANMIKDSKYADNKELYIIPGASHTDLYDGGGKNAIPFDKLAAFFEAYLR